MNSFYNSGKNALVFMFGDSYWWKTVLEFIVFYKIIGKKSQNTSKRKKEFFMENKISTVDFFMSLFNNE